jgi:hypothetical protein
VYFPGFVVLLLVWNSFALLAAIAALLGGGGNAHDLGLMKQRKAVSRLDGRRMWLKER